MPLTLEEYAEYLDKRGDLSWPAPPTIAPRKARPHLVGLPGIRGVVWSCYGVLVAISGGELVWLPQDKFVAELAFEKLVREFKLWQAMTRRPGNPAEHLRVMYQTALDEQQFQAGGRDRYPEVRAEKVWEAVFKKLKPSEFNFDPLFYGSLDEFCLKVAYFYQRSIQGTQAMPGALAMLQWVSQHLEFQGLLADGQGLQLAAYSAWIAGARLEKAAGRSAAAALAGLVLSSGWAQTLGAVVSGNAGSAAASRPGASRGSARGLPHRRRHSPSASVGISHGAVCRR
jgi:hypothetical protein